MTTISQPKLSSLKVIVPPIAEQDRIVNYIEKTYEKFVQAVDRAENEIQFLQEYRTALISEVVTGKIDVRENFQYKEVEETFLLAAEKQFEYMKNHVEKG
jgi:uncharacterized UPF0160 family protein